MIWLCIQEIEYLRFFSAFESLRQKQPLNRSFPRGVHRIRVLLRRGIAFDLFGDSPVAPRLGGRFHVTPWCLFFRCSYGAMVRNRKGKCMKMLWNQK